MILATIDQRKKNDKKILLTFVILLILVIISFLYHLIIIGDIALLSSADILLNGLVITFFFTGVTSWIYYRKNRILNYKKILLYLVGIFGIIILISFSGLFMLFWGEEIEIIGITVGFEMFTFTAGLISSILGLVLTYFFFLIIGFGVNGFLSAYLRKKTPDLLNQIKDINENSKENAKEQGKIKCIHNYLISWMFDIPPYLNTKTLKIKKLDDNNSFPKSEFRKAIVWEIIICVILALNISLNPLLLEHFSLSELFGLTSSVATFTPLIVLPWFVFLGLEAKISGPVKDLWLYEGLKNRIMSLLVATGTLITFIRLSIERINIYIFLYSFIGYLVSISILSLLFTFVYFNHFWKDLVQDIYSDK